MKEICGMFVLSCWDVTVIENVVECLGECFVGRFREVLFRLLYYMGKGLM